MTTRNGRTLRPQHKALPDFYAPAELPQGESVVRHGGGRRVTPRMPVDLGDGTVVRPRAKGSRAAQPPVRMGALTRELPLTKAIGTVPYRGLMSGAGRLIREYQEHQARCEEIWQFLEQVEQGLFAKADEIRRGMR